MFDSVNKERYEKPQLIVIFLKAIRLVRKNCYRE